MILSLGIKEPYFDELRRGVKRYEYRPRTPFYIRRFESKYINQIIFGHQGMQDKLTCNVNITEGHVPMHSQDAWYEIYDHDHADAYLIEIVGMPMLSYCPKQKLKGYPRKFGVVA